MESFLHNPATWVAASFLLLIASLYRPVSRAILSGLDARGERIRQELVQAETLRKEAETVLASYRQREREVLKEAEEILAQTKAEAESMARAAEAELQTSLEKRSKLAKERIAQAENQAVAQVRAHVVDIAISAARTILQDYKDKGAADDLLRQAIGDIERKLH